jgi:L-lactate dehydrogenase (cytochrome)
VKVGEAVGLLELKSGRPGDEAERLRRCHSFDDMRHQARRRLPRAIFDYVDGAADDEVVLTRNRDAFKRVALTPRCLRGNVDVDLGSTMLGAPSALPIAIAPCAQAQLLHPGGEATIGRAADAAGIPYIAPAMGGKTIEQIAAAGSGQRWFQVYLWRDRGLTEELVARAAAAGYSALVVTVDTPVSGSRNRDLGNGLTIPPKLRWPGIVDSARRPRWVKRFLAGEMPSFANVSRPGESNISTMNYVGGMFDPAATWDGVASLVEQWDGPVAIKGILDPSDARRAVEIGADAVIVSNHGGRQFGRAPATLDVLPLIADEIRGEAEILLDSGITRGVDVLAALALGADACLVGRAALFGLAVGGEAGVSRMLEILTEDLRRSMTLVGAANLDEVDRGLVAHATSPEWSPFGDDR